MVILDMLSRFPSFKLRFESGNGKRAPKTGAEQLEALDPNVLDELFKPTAPGQDKDKYYSPSPLCVYFFALNHKFKVSNIYKMYFFY